MCGGRQAELTVPPSVRASKSMRWARAAQAATRQRRLGAGAIGLALAARPSRHRPREGQKHTLTLRCFASPTIRKSGPAPEQRYRPHRKRATMPMPSLLLSATAVGQSRQRRTLAQHGRSGLRAVAGAASAASAAAGSLPRSERRVGVEVALREDAECRQSSGRARTGQNTKTVARSIVQLCAPSRAGAFRQSLTSPSPASSSLARVLLLVHRGRDRRARAGGGSVYESDSGGVLAARNESGDPQAPS